MANSVQEVEAVAHLFNQKSKVLLGEDATLPNVQANVGDYSYILFSTHGVALSGQPKESYLALANGAHLTTAGIYKLSLNAKVVVLSACQTHQGDILAGDELMSIARAFLVKGANSVLVTLWEVDEIATAAVVTNFFQHLQSGERPAQALQRAQKEYLKSQEKGRRSRPAFWAAFLVVGKT